MSGAQATRRWSFLLNEILLPMRVLPTGRVFRENNDSKPFGLSLSKADIGWVRRFDKLTLVTSLVTSFVTYKRRYRLAYPL
ncbi:MAG: hypothetical protein FD187_1969 [bacterium]|nr:MAG: hypothetical protein FD142_1639 [bacterium]KAF0148546.1 MAG: hypothetical protein FD187_1969 [bacterium]KAF0167270.1 MAG: hypothetical protein FD158_2417 [bacterium]TXT20719.1 MAG: hypothetical protein FD132_1086 [bacterium]